MAGLRSRLYLNAALKRRGKFTFLRSLPAGARLLDVGCGNASPMKAKALRPDLFYAGIDVGDYRQVLPEQFADQYVLTTPDAFAQEIRKFEGQMDAVVSSHNLEHCSQPEAVLEAMLQAIKPGGRLYLSFPCEASVGFPTRRGTLNFYDDASHAAVPQWNPVLDTLRQSGMRVDFVSQRYRPALLGLAGLMLEPLNAAARRASAATWALYGFESVIWASRPQ